MTTITYSADDSSIPVVTGVDSGFDLAVTRSRLEEVKQRESDIESITFHQLDTRIGIPWSQDVMSTLTDFYQITMTYAYWKAGKHNEDAHFEVFFRTCPFDGEFAVMGGVNDVLRFLNTFRFSDDQIRFLKGIMPDCDEKFFEYLQTLDSKCITCHAVAEGTLVFPQMPLVTIDGPLSVCQLLETCILNLLNFATLVATNAARYRLAAGKDKRLMEFGLRRAQGPDGGMTASRYVFMGGFDATSNVRAAFLFGLPCSGTHAHSFVASFECLSEIKTSKLQPLTSHSVPFKDLCIQNQHRVKSIISEQHSYEIDCKEGELAAFITYAEAFPSQFCCLVDTYSVLGSGVPNFLAVAISLVEYGYSPQGIRIDSGDLAYLSRVARDQINCVAQQTACDLSDVKIIASNSISEQVLHSLAQQDHSVDVFGIGTHLVTCSAQSALGMVYKLCQLAGKPRMKVSQEISKATLPCKKLVYRLYDVKGTPMLDYIQLAHLPPPQPGDKVFCRHLTDDYKRCNVIPSKVECLLEMVWCNGKATRAFLHSDRTIVGNIKIGNEKTEDANEAHEDDALADSNSRASSNESLKQCHNYLTYLMACRKRCLHQLEVFRRDHLRPTNPTPYKISASKEFFEQCKSMWEQTAPVVTYR